MTHDAYVFGLSNEQRLAGIAVICPTARYVSLRFADVDRPDRRHLSPHEWRRVEAELAQGLPASALPVGSALVAALVASSFPTTLQVQYRLVVPVEAAPVQTLATRLDDVSRNATPPQFRRSA